MTCRQMPDLPRAPVTVRLTPTDQAANPYFYVPVQVPEGTTRIDVRMSYAQSEDCIVDLGILDARATGFPSPQGFRGWSGGARDRFFVATDDATPGYIPGPMPSGTWHVVLGLYRIPADGTAVALTITMDDTPRAVVGLPPNPSPIRTGSGWYRGDLHCHTFHSDARGSPELLHAAARQAGLDFLAVSDHNTISQRRYFNTHAATALVFVRAMEVTTAVGHANVFGVDDWIDFRMSRPGDSHALADIVHAKGGLLSVNHDKPTIPWDYDLPAIDCMEVWQSHWLAWNWISLARYDERLRTGRTISLIGGSDFHQPDRLMPEGPLTLARPTTVLWLPGLSEQAVLAAMKAGNGYVSEAPHGPHLSFTANGSPMGSTVGSGAIQADVDVRGAAGDRLAWIDATGVVQETTVPEDAWLARFSFAAAHTFLRGEIVAEASRDRLVAEFQEAFDGRQLPWGLERSDLETRAIRRALTNPVYVR
jgi:predicted metal-dependent phosphoesterase TrpH